MFMFMYSGTASALGFCLSRFKKLSYAEASFILRVQDRPNQHKVKLYIRVPDEAALNHIALVEHTAVL